MADELTAALARRESAPAGLSGILSSMLDARADASWRVTRAWHAVNGDIERAHTTGTFVREPRRGEDGPVLVVYVDSRSRATDFAANSEVYVARLANAGLSFSKVEFRLSKYPARDRGTEGAPSPRPPAMPAPRGRDADSSSVPLPREEAAEIERACAGLPSTLRESVSRAMRASYRCQRDTQERKS